MNRQVCKANVRRNFSRRLKEMRLSHGPGVFTQKELASRMKVHQSLVCRWENEMAEPNLGDLLTLSQILGVSVDKFFS
jgi:transcriptional regulator with XRE-family HTH domain